MQAICSCVQTFDIEEGLRKISLRIHERYPQKKYYLGILFFTSEFDGFEFFKRLHKINFVEHLFSLKVYKLISNKKVFSPGIGILVFPKEKTDFLFFSNFEEKNFPDQAEKNLFQFLKDKGGQKKFIFHLIDTPLLKMEKFLRGIHNVLGTDFINLGTVPFQEFSLESNQIYYNGKIYKKYILSLIFPKDVDFLFSQKIGALGVGNPFDITQSYVNLIEKINNKPAASYILEFIGSQCPKGIFPQVGLYYPIGIYLKDKICLRNIIRFLDGEVLFCGGEIEEFAKGKLFLISNEEILKSAREAAIQIKNDIKLIKKEPELCLVFSGVSRLKSLGHKNFREIEEIKDILETEIFGFYAHREFSPDFCKLSKGRIVYQNASINILSFLR